MNIKVRIGNIVMLVLLATVANLGWAQGRKPTIEIRDNGSTIDVIGKAVRPSDLFQAVGKRYKLNLIADSFANELPRDVKLIRISRGELVASVAEITGREVIAQGKIVILRHNNYKLMATIDAKLSENQRNGSQDELTISTSDRTEKETLKKQRGGFFGIVKNYDPAEKVWIQTYNIVSSRFATEFSEKTGHTLSFGKSLKRRCLTMTLYSVTPSQCAEGIAKLFSGSQMVSIDSDEEDMGEPRYSPRTRHLKALSDQLMARLKNELAADQYDAFKKGLLEIDANSLNGETKGLANAYYSASANNLDPSILSSLGALSSTSGFALTMNPYSLYMGISTHLASGTPIHF